MGQLAYNDSLFLELIIDISSVYPMLLGFDSTVTMVYNDKENTVAGKGVKVMGRNSVLRGKEQNI